MHPTLEYTVDDMDHPESRIYSYCESHLMPTKEHDLYEECRDPFHHA